MRMFTIDAARAGHGETDCGSISIGEVADFVVLSEDPFRARDSIRDIRALDTFVAGGHASR